MLATHTHGTRVDCLYILHASMLLYIRHDMFGGISLCASDSYSADFEPDTDGQVGSLPQHHSLTQRSVRVIALCKICACAYNIHPESLHNMLR